MAWIESHQELARHPKTKRLARLLGVSLPAAVGHLHFLWWWAMDYAQDGDITKYDELDIADACGWEGDAEQMINALVESGFVDRTEEGLFIHDWYEYAGRLIEKREASKERARKSRERNAQRARNVRATNADVATLPNQTIPNHNTAAANAREDSQEPFPAAYRRVYQRDLTPYQAQELGAYIDQDGFEEAVIVRAIERAALTGGGIKLILHILNDYAAAGVKTLAGAISFDAEHDARKAKARGDPVNVASGQQAKIEYIRQKRKEAELREAAGSLGSV